MTEKKLKPGWRRVKFGDVVQLSKARCADPLAEGVERYVGLEHLEPGDLRIRNWGNVADGVTFTSVFRPGQVLFGKRRAYQRKVAVADFSGVCSGDIYVMETKDATVLMLELLPFICQTDAFFDHAVGTSAGSLSPRTNWTSLSDFEFELPPLEKQHKAVELLQAASHAANAQDEALSHLQAMRKSAIDYLLAFPEDGQVARLETVGSMQNGRPFPADQYADHGLKLLRPGNLGSSGYLQWAEGKTVCLDPAWEKTAEDFVIQPGDVVINLTAQSLDDGFMGRVCLAKENDKSLLNQRIGRFRCNEELLLPEFLFRCLQTTRFRQHAHANCEGSKVKHMFWQHLAKYEIAVPKLSIQRDVIDQCADVDQAIDGLTRRLKSSRDMSTMLVNRLAGVR
ncbi:restriction endonuclease subunit S [Rhodoferax sp.]|uniref:restriction endonuclease subunit S n=1 Tax=Rhodoferax sp. TaxID=50421 RepID=UPI0025F6A211|nr:restriction endonuclease subunit S [Rhodoferax sp.]MCM2339799.1 restriction endonuclease subunit S [Rhodoferax sp.]